MPALTIVEAGPEQIDAIKPLWEQLNRHHASVSAHFADYFEKFEFEQRKAGLLSKAEQGSLRLFLAQIDGEIVGQCVVSLQSEGAGEIDSIYVNPTFRGQRIGDKLMRAALRWFDDNGATSKSVVVIHGNESTHAFYARYGFLPRSTRLAQP